MKLFAAFIWFYLRILPKEMTNFERHIDCIFPEIYRAEPRCETTFITLRR